ncbi:hypothetical protein F4859DRAFT_182082 [Xylaria cf. heliscus]|nr:hypothetical protein F4859DRAFT_182082 [Xylaria cf. heliscus]
MYDTRVFVKRPGESFSSRSSHLNSAYRSPFKRRQLTSSIVEYRKDGKTFIRPRLEMDCMPPEPDGFACYPVIDPVDTTYREELDIPQWTGSD